MTDKERVEYFKEDCKSVISKFRTTLFNYDFEKNNDFRGFAISTATDSNKVLTHLHLGVISMIEGIDKEKFLALHNILCNAIMVINEDMKHAYTYVDFVNYLEIKQK